MTRAMLVLVAAGILLAPAATHASPAAKGGQIAYSRYRYVNSPLREEIWAANPDGTGQHQITRTAANYVDIEPDWAPGGRSLIFTRCAPVNGQVHEGRCTIWSVKADGSSPRMLSPRCTKVGPSCPDDSDARYSPDGRNIVVARYEGVPGIAITDASLQHAHRFFPFGDEKGAPDINGFAWSPDGKQLAFTAHDDNGKRVKPVGGEAVFVMRSDGTGVHRVTAWKLHADDELDWSPDGNRILFRTVTFATDDPGPSYGDIYTIHPDGSGLRRLTHLGTGVELGSYSPDGKSIVFSTNAGGTPGPASAFPDVFTMDASGGHLEPVTRTRNWEGMPDWGAG